MINVYVVGGNGFAKECVFYIREIAKTNPEIRLGGLVGHNGFHPDFGVLDNLFCGDLSEMNFGPDDYCVIGAGYPELRRKIFNDILRVGGKFYTLVSIDTYIPDGVDIGIGNCFISSPLGENTGIKIGNGNLFNGGVVIGHDTTIGDFNFCGPRSALLGNVHIGNDNTIGTNAILLPHSKIGDGNKIAPLSAVYRGCRNKCYMAGNPAEHVGDVE